MNQNYIKGYTSTNQPGQTINYTVQNSGSNNYRLGGYNQQSLSQKNTVQLQNQIQNNVNALNYQQNIPLTQQNQNNNNNYNNNNSNNQGSSYKSSNNSNQIPAQVSTYSNQTKTYFQTVGQSPIIKTQGQINASNNVGFNNTQLQTKNIGNIKSENKPSQQGLENKNQDKYQLQPITSSRSQISYINEQPKNDDNKKELNTQPQVYQKEEFMKSKSRISLTKNSGSYRSSGNGNEAGTNTQYENNQIQNFGSYQAINSQNNNQSPYSLSGSCNKGDNNNNVNNNINNNYGGNNNNNNYTQQQQISQPQNSNNIKNSNTSINNNNNSNNNQQSYSAYQKEEYRKRKAQNAQAGNQSTSNRVSGLGFSKFNEENAQYQNSQPSSGIPYLEKKHSSMNKAYSQQVFVSNQEQQQQLNNLYDQNQNNQKCENNSNANNNYYGTVGFNYQEEKQKNLQHDQNQTYKQRYTYSNNKNENNYQNHQNESQKVGENKEVKKLDLFGENDKIKNLDSFSKQVSSPKPGLINNFNLNNKIKDEKKEQSYQTLTQTYKEQAQDLVQKQNQLPELQQKISANSTGHQGAKQVYQQFSNNQINPSVYGQNLQEKYQIQQQNQLNQQGKDTSDNKIQQEANISSSKSKYKESKRRSLTPQYNQQYQRKQNIQNTQNLHKQITTTTHYLGNKKITVKTEEDSQNNKRIVTKITEEMASDGKTVLSKQKVTSTVDMSSDYMSSKKLAEIEKTMNKEEKEQYFNDLQLLAQQNQSYTNKNQTLINQNQNQQQNQNLSLNQQQQNLSQNQQQQQQNLIQKQQLSSKQNSNQEQGQKIIGQNLDNLNPVNQFQVKSEFMKSYDPVLEGRQEEISSQNNSLGKNYNQNLNQNQNKNKNQNQQNITNYTKTTPLSVAEFNEAQKIKKQDLVIKTNSGNSNNNINNNNQLQVQDLKSSDNVLVPSGKPSFTNSNQNQEQLQLQSKSSANQQENQGKESQRISQNAQNQEQKTSNSQGQNGSTHQNLSKTQYKIQENDLQEKAVSYYNVPKRKDQKNQRISYSLAEGSSKEYRTLSNLVNQSQNSQNQISNQNLMNKQNNNDYDDSISNIESAKSKNYIDLQSNIKNIDVQSINSSKYNRDYTPQYGRHGVISYKHQNGVSSFSNNVNYLQNKNKDQKNYFFGESLSELQIQREGSETIESGKISQKQQSSQQQKEGFNSGNSLIKNIQHEKIHEKPSIMEDSKNSGNQNLHNLTGSRSKSQERQYNSRFSPSKQDNTRQQQPSTFQLQHQKNLENQNQSQNQNQGDNSSKNLSHIEQVKQQDRFYALNLLNKYKNTIQHTQSLRGDSPGGSSDFQFTGGQKNPFQVIKAVHKSATPRNDAENISWQQAVQKNNNNNNNDINYPNKDSFQKGEDQLGKQKDKNIKKMPFPQAYRWSLKNFSIFKALGKGIFGTVYLAKEKTNNYLMALKVMEKSKIHEMNLVDQTMKELKIHYYLDHPNILQCYGYFPTQTQLIMALEYCYGGNLYEKLYKQPNRRFREQEGANYIAQIISAVQYLHKNHIIHRDIKPENILLNNDTVKLSDFGIASFNDGMRQTFCGTLEYVSPEIIDRQLYDYNVDVWAIGVLAYEICNGDPPFMGKDQKRIIQNVAFNMPRHFSVELKDFVNSLLRKNPNERMDLDQAMKHPWIQKNCVLYSQKSEKANAVIGQQQSDLFI